MSSDAEKKLGLEKYKAAQDASMIVATAKLFVFDKMWKELMSRSEVAKLSSPDTEMVRRILREAVASMDDTLFFFPPDVAGTKKNFERVVEHKLQTGLKDQILAEFRKRMKSQDSSLLQYTK